MKNSVYERLIFFILLVYAAINITARFVLAISYLPEIGGGMSINMMYGIVHLQQTGVLYLNPEHAPFSIIQYTPYYYYFINFIVKLFPGEHSLHQTMVIHRILCLILNILYCVLISITIKKIFSGISNKLIASFGLLLFITTPNINFERIDNLYLLFTTIALCSFLVYLNSKEKYNMANKKLIIISGIACGLALLTKQTAIWTIGLLSFWILVYERNFKLWFKFIITIAIVFIPHLIYMTWDHLGDFKLNTIDGLKNGIGIDWFIQVFVKGYFTRFAFLIVIGLYIGGWKLAGKSVTLKSFIGLSILYFFFIALVFSLKYGASQNYFIEFTIMTIFGLAYLINNNLSNYSSYLIICALYIPFLIATCATDKYWNSISQLKSSAKDFKVCEEITDYITKNKVEEGYIYSNFHTENCLNLMLTKSTLFPCREVAFVQTYPHGVFKFKEFGDLLAQGKIKYIIDKANHFPNKILYASPLNYVTEKNIGEYTIYKYQESTK